MSDLPSHGGGSWGDDSMMGTPLDSSSSYSSGSYHAVPQTYQLPSAIVQTVLVAGCSAGIGFNVAETYAAAGARLILTSRSQGTLDQAVASIAARYPAAEVIGRLHDFADEAAVRALWAELAQGDVFVDVLILNVAKKWPPSMLLGMGSKKGRKGFSYNLLAPGFWTDCFTKQRERDATRDLYLLDLTTGDSQNPALAVPVLLSAGSPSTHTSAPPMEVDEMNIFGFNHGSY